MSEYQLTREIVARSEAKVWDAAKLEWAIEEVYKSEEPDTCLCGHFPIIGRIMVSDLTIDIFSHSLYYLLNPCPHENNDYASYLFKHVN